MPVAFELVFCIHGHHCLKARTANSLGNSGRRNTGIRLKPMKLDEIKAESPPKLSPILRCFIDWTDQRELFWRRFEPARFNRVLDARPAGFAYFWPRPKVGRVRLWRNRNI